MLNRNKLATLLVLVCVWPALAWGQQEMRSATKGSSTPLPITGTVIDANHNGLDVNVVGGSVGGGGDVQTLTIASGVTTNTTTAAVAGVRGEKTYWARVAGTGAVTATVEFLGCHSTTVSAAECVSLGTIALSGTTSKYNVPTPAVGTANYPYMAVTTTNVTGTGATVSAGVFY